MVKREICSTYTGSNTPVINTTNCVIGDGTIGSPVDLRIDPSGNIICGPNGLNVSGITANATVNTSGCIVGDGTAGDPIRVQLDPSGGIECGPNGLFVTRECGMDVLGAVAAVDFSTGFAAKGVNISANPTVLTFTATTNCWYTLQVTNVTGTGTITWPGNVLWSGTPPQPTAGAGNISVFELWYDGTNFHGRQ